MRRAVVTAAAGLLGISRIAQAEPWAVTLEAGAEADSNVQRMETAPGNSAAPIAAPVGCAGARIDHKGSVADGGYALNLSGLGRMVASDQAKDENVMMYAGQLRWLRPIGAGPISAGFNLTAADAAAITGGIGARTFRNLGADGLISLGNRDGTRLTLAAGGRDFTYKPDHVFNWYGPAANVRLDAVLWQTEDKTRSLELATTLAFEARHYASKALIDMCPPDSAASSSCSTETTLVRRDRYQRANAELTWTGGVVLTAGYQLTVIDSNSYGQSLVRHRMMTAVTAELPGKLFGTLIATLQLDQYPDGVLVEKDVQRQEFTNLEDENRSSLQIRIARELSPAWSLEVRGAVWRDFGTADTATFHRELITTGVIYAR
jgi:hypothetical protein